MSHIRAAFVRPALAIFVFALLFAPKAPAQSAPGSYREFGDPGGFLNILPPGQDGVLDLTEALTALGGGATPPHFDDQLHMYGDLVYNAPGLTEDRILEFFKDASFGVRPDDVGRTYSPGGRTDVVVIRDLGFDVPHIFGETREGTMFASGYVAAEDRLFLMDALRHLGRARLSELVGAAPGNVAMDRDQLAIAPYLESDFTDMVDAAVASAGADGPVILADLLAYTDGVNTYINEALADPTKLPAEYPALQQTPSPWIAEDTVAIAVLVGGIFGKGGGGELRNHCGLQALESELGSAAAARQVFDDLKFADDAEAPTSSPDTFPYMSDMGAADPAAHPDIDCSSLVPIDDGAGSILPGGSLPDPQDLLGQALDAITNGLSLFPSSLSNALLISGDHTTNGKPIAVFGPQTSYYEPQLLVEKDIHGPDIDARGVAFAGTGIYIELGRGRDYAFSATSASADLVDQWVLILCEPGGGPPTMESMGYVHDGGCVAIESWTHTMIAKPSAAGIPSVEETECADAVDNDGDGFVNDGCPTVGLLPELLTQCLNTTDDDGDGFVNDGCPPMLGLNSLVLSFDVQRSEHYGPLTARGTLADGTPIAIATQRSTYMNELGSARGFYQINNPNFMTDGVNSFRQAMGAGIDYTFNWFYVDAKDIAYQHSGLCPKRAPGTDPYLPTIGDGTHDWQGFLTLAEQPFSINPAQGYLTSWNNKQAPGFLSHDRNFDYGPVYRNLMLDARVEPLVAAGTATRTDMIDAMEDAGTVDLRGQEALSLLLQVMGAGAPGGSDPRAEEMRDRLAIWLTTDTHRRDFDADGEYDDPQSAAIMDAWWPRLAHAMFDTTSGNAISHLGLSLEDGNRRAHVGSAFQGEFVSQVNKDLRQVLGLPVADPMSQTYCGGGNLAQCAADLWAAMDQAAADLETEFASASVKDWKRTVADEAVVHTPLGVVGVDEIHWINRPTFQQVVQIADSGPFKCYKSRNAPGTEKPSPQVVGLLDAFESKATLVRKPVTICNSAGLGGDSPKDPDAHLACYRIKDEPGQPKFAGADLTVTSQFGQTPLRARRAFSVCVPSGVDAVPATTDVDRFKCYKAPRRPGGSKFVKQEVQVTDDFEDKTLRINRPDLVCNAVDQDGQGVIDEAATLVCYKAKRGKGTAKFTGQTVDVTNDFGADTQRAIKPRHVCVPSQRSVP